MTIPTRRFANALRQHIQLCLNEPKAFTGGMVRYGKFKNVKNYVALIGKKDSSLEEKSGYYGEAAMNRQKFCFELAGSTVKALPSIILR